MDMNTTTAPERQLSNALAIVRLCENAAWNLTNHGHNAELAEGINTGLKLVIELLGAVIDLESEVA